jgi:hypothetical protein
MSAALVEMLEAAKAVGVTQEKQDSTCIKSTAISLVNAGPQTAISSR